MALFAASDAFITARLRLTSVPTSSEDTLAIIAQAILEARLDVYRRLGQLVVARILETAEVAAPETDDEIRRTLASSLEVKLVRQRLLRELPSAFMDASGDLDRRWNEETPFREMPRSGAEREAARLAEEIEQGFQMLEATEESPGNERSVFTFLSTPENPAPLPGESLIPRACRRSELG